MVFYYVKRGDMYRVREVFESMRVRGIELILYVYIR